MILAALVAAAAVKLAPMAEPFVVTDATALARWDIMWESDEFWTWCFGKKSNGEVEVGK